MTRLLPAVLVLVALLSLLSPTLAGVEPVGHIGGPSGPIVVQGAHAFVGMGPRMLVMDISTPATPTLLGQSPFLSAPVEDILVDDGFACLINATGVHLLRLDNLTQPTLVGSYPMAAGTMVKAGNYLYVSDREHGLRVLDVSNPTAPTLVARYESATIPNDLLRVGNHLYLVLAEGLEVLDIATPTAPRRVGGYAAEGAMQLARADNTLYLITQQSGAGTLHLIDITAPASPTALTIYLTGPARKIAVGGQRAYLAESGGLRVLDVSNRSAPRFLTYLASEETIVDLAADESRLSLTKFYTGLYLFNVEAAGTLRLLGQYRTVAYPTNVALRGSHAYVPDSGGALHVLDLTNPLAPQPVAQLPSSSFPSGIAISDTLGYVAESGGVRVLDLSTPQAPAEVGYYPMPTYENGADYGTGVAIKGDLAYLTYLGCRSRQGCGFGGIRILDISTPQAPVSLAAYGTGQAYDIAIAGNYAYLATGDLLVLELSNPITPTAVGFYDVPGGPTGARGVESVGEFVYVHHEGPGVLLLNASHPTEPVEAARYPYHAPSVAGGLEVTDGYLYLANPFGGLYVLEQHFTARGRVVDVHGAPLVGVTLTSSAGTLRQPDASGHYTLSLGLPGTVTLTPTRPGYAFAPPSRTVTLPPELVNQDFTLVAAPRAITLMPGVPATLRYTDTQGLPTELRFPASAVTQTTTIVITPTVATAPPGSQWSGHAFELAAYQDGLLQPDFRFQAPVMVVIRYSEQDLRLISNEAALSLQRKTEEGWAEAPQSCDPPPPYQRNPAGNEVAAGLCQVGTFALFGPTQRRYLPLLQQ